MRLQEPCSSTGRHQLTKNLTEGGKTLFYLYSIPQALQRHAMPDIDGLALIWVAGLDPETHFRYPIRSHFCVYFYLCGLYEYLFSEREGIGRKSKVAFG